MVYVWEGILYITQFYWKSISLAILTWQRNIPISKRQTFQASSSIFVNWNYIYITERKHMVSQFSLLPTKFWNISWKNRWTQTNWEIRCQVPVDPETWAAFSQLSHRVMDLCHVFFFFNEPRKQQNTTSSVALGRILRHLEHWAVSDKC